MYTVPSKLNTYKIQKKNNKKQKTKLMKNPAKMIVLRLAKEFLSKQC